MVGVRRQTVNIWLRRYRGPGGNGVLDGRRVSSRLGNGRPTMYESLRGQGWIRGRTADHLKLQFALCTSRAVRNLIELWSGRKLGRSIVRLNLWRRGHNNATSTLAAMIVVGFEPDRYG